MPYRYRLISVYIVVMLLAALLAGFIYLNDQRLQDTSDHLFDKTLPNLRIVNQLRSAKVEHERLLYEYYATTDRLRLLPAIQSSQQLMTELFNALLDQQLGMFDEAKDTLRTITLSADKLDQNLKNNRVDWDLARSDLIVLSDAGRRLDPYLDNFVKDIENEAWDYSQASRSGARLGTQLVISFCIAIIALAIFVAIYVNRYLRETAERKRLAMFVERNPSPVISTTHKGEVNYLNPAARQLVQNLGIDTNGQALVPADFLSIWSESKTTSNGIISLHEHIFEYNFSPLKDLELAHIHYKDITDQRQAEQALNYQAKHDMLTRLPNRAQLELQLAKNTHRSDSFFLVILTIRDYERLTATYGYQYGDQLLCLVSERLQQQLAPTDLLAPGLCRLDGANFAFMVTGSGLESSRPQQVHSLTHELADSFSQAFSLNNNEFFLTLCMGISQFNANSRSASGLLQCADSALMQSRKEEHNNIQFYNQQLQNNHNQHLKIETELRQAIDSHELCLFYQPKLDNKTGEITGCESLLRWLNSDGNPRYSPLEFIPIAEQSGLIIPLGEWVLKTAFAQADWWRKDQEIVVAINLSPRQFLHHNFLPLLEQLKRQYPGIERYIELEITESLLMQNINSSLETMYAIKRLGFKLSIDDFGTGYSSLSYLKSFPVDKLKIDRSFVVDMTTNKEDKMLVETIIQLAHSLGFSTVAEGVETLDQLQLLRDMDCTETQGYLVSKPLPAQAYDEFIEAFRQQAPAYSRAARA